MLKYLQVTIRLEISKEALHAVDRQFSDFNHQNPKSLRGILTVQETPTSPMLRTNL